MNESAARAPVGALRSAVVAHHGYRQRGLAPAEHRGLPSPYLTVIFTLHEPLHVARHVHPHAVPGHYRTLIGGLHTSPALIRHDGAQSGIQLAMNPLGARALFGLPAGELAGIDLDAADVLGPFVNRVQDRLAEAPTWRTRFAILDEVLGPRLDFDLQPPAQVRRAWALLCRSGGTKPVSAIARDVGWGERHLANRFRTEIGLTPKTAARVIRFYRTRRDLQRSAQAGLRPALAEAAASHGYFDQSHLVRDFTQFSGLAPSAWLSAEVGNFQVAGSEDTPDLAS